MRAYSERAAALAVLVAALFASTIAQAGFTAIHVSPDQYDEPNLIGWNPFPDNPNPSVLETLYGENNLRRIDDSLDIALKHTADVATVKAVAHFTSARGGFGYFTSSGDSTEIVLRFSTSLGGYEPQILGAGLIEPGSSGEVFELFLFNTLVTSNPAKNPSGLDLLVTFEIVGNDGHPENQLGNYVLAWEDRFVSASDRDFQDAVFELSGVIPVSEPTSLLLLTSTLLAFRRRNGSS